MYDTETDAVGCMTRPQCQRVVEHGQVTGQERNQRLTVLVPYKVSKLGQGTAVPKPWLCRVLEHMVTLVYATRLSMSRCRANNVPRSSDTIGQVDSPIYARAHPMYAVVIVCI